MPRWKNCDPGNEGSSRAAATCYLLHESWEQALKSLPICHEIQLIVGDGGPGTSHRATHVRQLKMSRCIVSWLVHQTARCRTDHLKELRSVRLHEKGCLSHRNRCMGRRRLRARVA